MDTQLFKAEISALERAQAVVAVADLETHKYRLALQDLVQHYHRLMREMHRLIRHGDRTEAALNDANTELQRLSAELDYKARHDDLTGTLNRGAVFELAQRCLRDAPLSLIILDIDFFKHVNDAFGHPTGDAVLQELVQRLSTTLSGQGHIGRVGGEEFSILLPNKTLREAASIAESMRRAIAEHPFSCLPSRAVTASFGIGCNERGTSFEQAYLNADAALYRAKERGRNQVVLDRSWSSLNMARD